MDIAKEFPPDVGGQGSGLKCVKTHIHHFLHADLQKNPIVRDMAVNAKSYEDLIRAIDAIKAYHRDCGINKDEETQDWYYRHRIENEYGELVGKAEIFGKVQKIPQIEIDDDAGCCIEGMFGGVDGDGDADY